MKLKWILTTVGLFSAISLPASILFISHNTPASEAVTKLVVAEYNYMNDYPGWIDAQIAAGESTSYSTFTETSLYLDETEIPNFDTLLANRLSELGLQPGDPADKGFTDLLKSKGYDVVRSTGQIISEPDTANGETAFDNLQYAVELTPELKAELNSYELIIMSRDIGNGFAYSLQGRVEGQEGALTRILAWNQLTVPLITMNHAIPTGSEFDFRWGWSYGFTSSNPNTITKYIANKDTNEQIDPLELNQIIKDPQDPVFEGITLPENGFINIYDDTIFRPSSIRKFENNENFEYGIAVKEVLQYDIPNFIATDGSGNTLDISTKDPLILRLVSRRSLFTLQANISDPFAKFGEEVTKGDLVQRVIGPRLYFAAGMHDHGIYNLNSIGEKMFLNAVGQYATPSETPGLVVGEWSRLGYSWVYGLTPNWGLSTYMGYIYLGDPPYIYQDDSGWLYPYYIDEVTFQHIFYSYSSGWVFAAESNGGWIYTFKTDSSNGEWMQFPQP